MKKIKGLTGAASIGVILLVSVVFALSAFAFVGSVFGDTHDATVTISPDIANCDELGDTFTVNIYNEIFTGADSIFEVRIYEGGSLEDFDCGSAPTGWTLFDFTAFDGYCEYKTTRGSAAMIDPGENLDFTFDAVMIADACYSSFMISTLDDATPVGEHEFNFPEVDIDCVDPVVIKTVGDPKIAGDGFNWWITQSTIINVEASDSTDDDECNLGLDYCQWKFRVDDGSWSEWQVYENGEEIDFDFSFVEDSVHDIIIECYDVAGNKVVIEETDKVDDTPPITEKWFEGPQKTDGFVEWIDDITKVVLEASDPDPTGYGCNIGVTETWYKNVLTSDTVNYCEPDDPCEDISICQSLATWETANQAPGDWLPYIDSFTKDEESCHVLFYYSVDELGNKEEMQTNCFFVDKTAPEMIKTIGDPQYGNCQVPRQPEWCEGWGCLGDGEKDFFITGREDPTNWEMAIWNGDPEQVETQGEYSWVNGGGDPVPFTVSYDPTTGLVTYDIDGTELTWTYDSEKAFEYLVIMAKGKHTCQSACEECDTILTDIQVNGKEIGDVISSGNYQGVRVYLTDSEQINGFTVTGNVVLDWDSGCKKQEIPAFHVFAMNTHDPDDCWVRDHVTPITLDCNDPEPHPSGDEEVCFKVSYDLDPYDITAQYCSEELEDGWCCVDAPEEIIFVEDSWHDLEWFCRDAVDKTSEIDIEYFRVDSQPPVIEKDMFGSYLGDCPSGTDLEHCDCYVADDGTSGVDVTVYDDMTYDECIVGIDHCNYELWWNDEIVDEGQFSDSAHIVFEKDSTHTLKIWCWDFLGNEVYDEEDFLVDSTPPETTKTYVDDLGELLPPYFDDNQWEYIDTVHKIKLEAEDEKVGVEEIRYRVSSPLADSFCESCENWMTSLRPDMGPWQNYVEPFGIDEESCHVIEYSSVDRLGNEEDIKWQCVFVDKTKPITEKTYEGPVYENEGAKYIDGQTLIVLTADDPEPHPSGVAETQYRVSGALADSFCDPANCEGWMTALRPDMGDWQTYENPFGIAEESCHVIEYRSIDNVGKTEDIQWQCIFVDHTPPIVSAITGDPKIECDSGDICDYWIMDHETPITLSCYDPEPHPSGVKLIEYRWKLDDGDWTSWAEYTEPIIFEQDSVHYLEYRCTDNVDKTRPGPGKVYRVDSTPPETTKTYEGPQYPEAVAHPEYINSKTQVILDAIDPDPTEQGCNIGVAETQYRVSDPLADSFCEQCENWMTSLRPDMGDWIDYTESFTIDEDSCHVIEYRSVDLLGNEEEIDWQCVYVDNQPPEPVKTVGEPKEVWDGLDARFYDLDQFCTKEDACWKITLMTPISLACVDPDPHPVDHETVCFKVELDAENATDMYCDEEHYNGNMNENNGFCCLDKELDDPFYFNELSEHNLAYYCVDALGNKGTIDDEKFKVEETAFNITINKKWNLISVPVVLLDDSMDEVFDDLEECVDLVWTYDAETGEEYWYTPDGVDNDNLHTMLPGWGYWVLASDDCMLTIGGSLMSPAKLPPTKIIMPGWNMIGYYGAEGLEEYDGPEGNGKQAYEALCSLGASWWDKGFTSLLSYWEPDNPHVWIEFERYDEMDPGAGYWMFAPEGGLYTYSTACGWLD